MDKSDKEFVMNMIALLILFVGGIFLGIHLYPELSQQTLDDICINLAENDTAVGEVQSDGILLCTIPSFDSTHNIVIKQGGEDG